MSRPRNRPHRRPLSLAVAAILALASGAGAQAPAGAPLPNWDSGWHVVRPGDTLGGLARRFLGSATFWQELHRLNPDIADPDMINPGKRIRIWIARPSAQPNAQVEQVAGKVEERPSPVPWRPAATGDLLLERDGLRTFATGSTRLRFEDESTVTLTENSLVFLRRQTPPSDPTPRREIEVQVGRADVEAPAPTAGRPAPEIDIVLGPARAKAKPGASGAIHARSSAESQGTARLMIYRGAGELASAGASVDLAEGTGSIAAPSQPPTPPERLLPAPELTIPPPAGELGLDEPVLVWQPVGGAASYDVEVCLDDACSQLFERAAGLADTRFRLTRAPEGELRWRVTAVSATGLEGYPATARTFRTVDSVGPPPPSLALRREDGSAVAEGDCVAALPRLEVDARDRYGRELAWRLAIDGAESPAEAWTGVRASGPHRVAAVALDAKGRTAASPEVGFTLDQVAPWADLAARDGAPADSFWRSPRHDFEAVCEVGLEVSLDGASWQPVPCSEDPAVAPLELALSGFEGTLALRAGAGARLGGRRPALPGEPVRFPVGDLGCGLAGLAVRVAPERADGGAPALDVTVRDLAGREGRSIWTAEAR